MKLTLRWYDLWVGAYWDRRERVLYVCPLPCVVLRVGTPRSASRSLPRSNQSYAVEFRELIERARQKIAGAK